MKRITVLGLLVALLLAGCDSSAVPQDPTRYPTWPHAGIRILQQYPYELTQGSALAGRWLSTAPGGQTVFAEATLPNFVIALPVNDRHQSVLLDLGDGTSVDNLAYGETNQVYFTGMVEAPSAQGSAVLTRAILEVDRYNYTMLSITPLPRDKAVRGFVTARGGRAYLYLVSGAGEGSILGLSLYNGLVLGNRRIGLVPAAMGRKGMAVDRDGRYLYCLTGGEAGVSDFTPVTDEPTEPHLAVVGVDSLAVVHRVALPGDYEPQAVYYHEIRERVYVVAGSRKGARIYEIDAAFFYIRNVVDLPSAVSDLALTELYGFAPAANGIYVIDLATLAYSARPGLPFTQTGEMSVTPDAVTGLIQFFSSYQGGGPGVAVVDLATGQLREVWN